MNTLLFGTAGIPHAAKGGDTLRGIEAVRQLGLDAMELEFVRNVNITEEKAPAVRAAAMKHNITLTCHASYFINLNAADKAKRDASRQRLYSAARIAALCGGWSTCVHAGAYLKMEKDAVYQTVKRQFAQVVSDLRADGRNIWVRPETAGKFTQWGTLQEILRLSSDLEGVLPCIDFGHMRATTGSNSYESFAGILAAVEKALGKKALKNMHIHTEGIVFSEKGERSHVNLKDSDINYKALAQAWKDYGLQGVVISESPNIEADARLLQQAYNA